MQGTQTIPKPSTRVETLARTIEVSMIAAKLASLQTTVQPTDMPRAAA